VDTRSRSPPRAGSTVRADPIVRVIRRRSVGTDRPELRSHSPWPAALNASIPNRSITEIHDKRVPTSVSLYAWSHSPGPANAECPQLGDEGRTALSRVLLRGAVLGGQGVVTGVKHLGKTRPFRGPDGKALRGSIAEVNYLRLGGVDQWVMIRGESSTNPPLILLHGGPGFSETHFFRRFNAPLEKRFTVVYWDQRGSGKSFDRKINRTP
jgi:alpha/beta hydrolase fold